jgi:hypothetical protein
LIARIVELEKGDFSEELAQYLLKRRFPPEDQAYLKRLAAKQRMGALTPDEEREMDRYIRVADFMEALKAKALATVGPNP